jgi:sugar lactone lactonase YvrE
MMFGMVSNQGSGNKHDSSTCQGTLFRRDFLQRACIGVAGTISLSGCVPAISESVHSSNTSSSDAVIGQRGLADGRFQKPRAMAISPDDQLFVIDKTARVQAFDPDGKFVCGWKTPRWANGKPTGATFDSPTDTLVVVDTHYFQFLFYSRQGELIEQRTIGGVNGTEPGQFGWVTDFARAPDGTIYLSEYGQYDRIYKYSADGQYIDRLGEHGDQPLQFSRPQSMAVDEQGLLWVADSCNHRIQVIDWREEKARSVRILGGQGAQVGQLQFPYGMTLASEDRLLVSEFGNHRVQCWTRQGKPISSWGSAGKEPGQLNQPWAVALDSKERVYVVDSGNNRIQRYKL